MNLKRPLCLFCAAFIAGILVLNGLGIYCFLSFIILWAITLLILFNKINKIILPAFISLIFFIAGGLLLFNAEKTYMHTFEGYYGKPVTVEGYIDSEAETAGDKIKFVLKIKKIIEGKQQKEIDGKIFVSIYTGGRDNEGNITPAYRTRVSFTADIDKPRPATNPGGFDYRKYLCSIGISGSVYLRNISEINVLGTEKGGYLHKLGFKIKNTVLAIVEYCLDKNQAGLLAGMIIGYKDGLDEEAFNAFSRAGLTHIMVASGMNVAFIILPLTFIFKKMHLPNLPANLITILVLILFVFVTGFSASVVRAVIMGIIILTGKIIMRETDIYTSIAAAAVILLSVNPFTLFDIGFQLSFAATISLVLFYPKIKVYTVHKYIPEIISDTLAATLAAQVGVIPVTLYYFNNLSIISILSNLLVVPVVQIITIIGFIMVFTGLLNIYGALLVGYINNTFLSFVLFVTETSAKLPFASIKLPTPSLTLILLYYCWLLYLLKGRQLIKNNPALKKIKWPAIIILAAVFTVSSLLPKPLEITFLDVGQGDSAFIKTAHGIKVLIDGGGREAGSKSGFDIGESVVVPFILDKGTKTVDIVIATHGHTDHTEGLETVLKELKVGMVILPDTAGEGFEKITGICQQKGIEIVECKQGEKIRLDSETTFDVLNPLKSELDSLAQQSLNESSLVLKLVYKNVKVLFTGDSGIEVEKRMEEQGLDVGADILKVGHHGSPGSSGEDFIKRVKPKYAAISVGENNTYGHPSQAVIDRIEESGARLFRTDKCGAVIASSYGSDFRIRTMLPTGQPAYAAMLQ